MITSLKKQFYLINGIINSNLKNRQLIGRNQYWARHEHQCRIAGTRRFRQDCSCSRDVHHRIHCFLRPHSPREDLRNDDLTWIFGFHGENACLVLKETSINCSQIWLHSFYDCRLPWSRHSHQNSAEWGFYYGPDDTGNWHQQRNSGPDSWMHCGGITAVLCWLHYRCSQ